MGCNTCNQQNQKSDVDLVTENLTSGRGRDNLLLKIGAFVGVVFALPIIIIALVFQVFMQFFLPKALPTINKKFRDGFQNIFKFFITLREKKELKKREREFQNNMGYEEGSELLDIEVYEDNVKNN